jgi:O-antigen ligase
MYIFFILLLFVAIIYSIKFPALAVALGVATFGLEQISLIILPQLQINKSLFNIILGSAIAISFLYNLFKRKINKISNKKTIIIFTLVLIYIGLYWISSLWSPFNDYENSIGYLRYYIPYIILLPMIISNPNQMITAFNILCIILLIGFIGLFITGDLNTLVSSQIGRAHVPIYTIGENIFTNPLTLADTGVLLSLSSILLYISAKKRISNIKCFMPRSIIMIMGFIGVGLGIWVAFLSSKAETIVGILCIIIYIILITAKNIRRAFIIMFVTILISGIVIMILYTTYYDNVIEYSPTFNKNKIEVSWNGRISIIIDALKNYASKNEFIVFGIGARGNEKIFGIWPHNAIIQSLTETGIVGLMIYIACILMTIKYGYNSYKKAKQEKDIKKIVWVGFVICLFLYNFVMSQKKGSLSTHDTYMWIVFSAIAFDRAIKYSNQQKENVKNICKIGK